MKLALSLLAFCPCLAAARIGETPGECAARYGPARVQEKAGDEVTMSDHVHGGISIRCIFSAGKCVVITFDMMLVSFIDLERRAFNPAEKAKLITANGGGSLWQDVSPGVYQTADKSRRATTTGGVVTIQTVAEIERRRELTAPDAIKKQLEGF